MKKTSLGGRFFDIFNITFNSVIGILAVLPFVYIVLASFTSTQEFLARRFVFIPTTFSLDGYRYIFSTDTILRGLMNSIYLVVVGTFFNLLVTTLLAYPLSRRELLGRKYLMMFVIFPMIFSGGMIPTYLVVRSLGLLNSLWALILVSLVNPFFLVIIKNFFQNIPEELVDAARIDGCGELRIFGRIILPLSKPVLATFLIFYAVGHWNGFFNAFLYLHDINLWPVQLWLRQVVIASAGGIGDLSGFAVDFITPPTHIVQMGVVVVSTLPILVIYPFMQRHFVKGVMLGSIKG